MPMDFDEIGPRCAAEMHPYSDAGIGTPYRVQPGPAPDPRMLPVGADDPSGAQDSIPEPDSVGADPSDRRAPMDRDTKIARALCQQPMQHGAAHPHTHRTVEMRLGDQVTVDEADAAEGEALLGTGSNSKLVERLDTFGHQTFSARLIDGHGSGVGNRDTQPAPARRDRGGQTGRPAADDHDIGFRQKLSHREAAPAGICPKARAGQMELMTRRAIPNASVQ